MGVRRSRWLNCHCDLHVRTGVTLDYKQLANCIASPLKVLHLIGKIFRWQVVPITGIACDRVCSCSAWTGLNRDLRPWIWDWLHEPEGPPENLKEGIRHRIKRAWQGLGLQLALVFMHAVKLQCGQCSGQIANVDFTLRKSVHRVAFGPRWLMCCWQPLHPHGSRPLQK